MTAVSPRANSPLPEDWNKSEVRKNGTRKTRQGDEKTKQVFHDKVPADVLNTQKEPILTEEEYLIREIMNDKGVSREVAQAEYDRFS